MGKQLRKCSERGSIRLSSATPPLHTVAIRPSSTVSRTLVPRMLASQPAMGPDQSHLKDKLKNVKNGARKVEGNRGAYELMTSAIYLAWANFFF